MPNNSKKAPSDNTAPISSAKNGCMIAPKTKEELAKIRAEHPVSIDVYTHSKCPHCTAFKPEAEKACVGLRSVDKKGAIPVVNCEVDKEFCAEDMRATGAQGVPYTVARINVPNAMFVVQGNNPKELNEKFDQLKSMVIEAKKDAGDKPVGKERRK